MMKLGLNEIRERYLRFFESKDHLRLQSFPLVPQNDKSLLLINSGMAPLKPYFTGVEKPPSNRITTCQKCIRTPDIENVGKTTRHGTFFEMLGNFSFGDYFKEDAIKWAWEFFTEDLEIPKKDLYVSVYEEDEEALDLWIKLVGLPKEKIFKLGKEDNFWEHGLGPCGPCSEIYFDRGHERGCKKEGCQVGCECDRFVEIWNLVFTQFNKDESGNYNELKNKNIDTGMGIERLACVMQDVESIFEVDTIKSVLDYVCELANYEYGKSVEKDISIRVITDHIRSTTMMIADGVIPTNEGRGYVLRRLLRRAARHGKLLGIEGIFLNKVLNKVIDNSKEAYPELLTKEQYIRNVITTEEEKFSETVEQGMIMLLEHIDSKSSDRVISGDVVFKLHDTYGFPVDLTREIALEKGYHIDVDGFNKNMKNQRNTAREALMKSKGNDAWEKGSDISLEDLQDTIFVGYEKLQCESKIIKVIKNGEVSKTISEGEVAKVIVDTTPFYAESGGQVGDVGVISSKEFEASVKNCTKSSEGKFIHDIKVNRGILNEGDLVTLTVDEDNRKSIMRNHTATHLLHKSLKNNIGSHVNQAGSLVNNNRLRFDFNHFKALTKQEIVKIENEVNRFILKDLKLNTKVMSMDEAVNEGATALFGEKYGNVVRVVSIDKYSVELCGGTHISSTSQIGLFKIISETGIASGVRRIEAVTGSGVLDLLNYNENILDETSQILKAPISEVVKKVENINTQLKEFKKEITELKSKIASSNLDDNLRDLKEVDGIKILVASFEDLDAEMLRNNADIIRNKIGECVVVIGSSDKEKCTFVATATKSIVSRGVHAGKLIGQVAKIAGGSGGGRPDLAQAGGKDVTKMTEALAAVDKIIKSQLNN